MWCFGAFVAAVVLLIVWAVVIAPGRTRRLFAGLTAKGWQRVGPEDEGLKATLDALLPIDLTVHVPGAGERPSVAVDSALTRPGAERPRYLVQLRVHSRNAFNEMVMSFSTLALETRALGFLESSVYILDKTMETRIASSAGVLGLQRAHTGLDPGFAGLFLVLEGMTGDARLPSALQQALLASSALFVHGAGHTGRYLPRVCLRLVPSGWALMVPEPITTGRQMRAFLDAADAVGAGLSVRGRAPEQ